MNVKRAFTFVDTIGREVCVVTNNEKVAYSYDLKNWSYIQDNGSDLTFDPDYELRFASINYKLYMTNGNSYVTIWDGTTVSRIETFNDSGVDAADTKSKHITVWNNRIWLFNSQYGADVAWYLNADNVSVDSTNYIAIRSLHSSRGMGMGPTKFGLVFIKEDGEFLLRGTGPENYVLEQIGTYGTVSPDSIRKISNTIVYLSREGYVITDGIKVIPLLNKINNVIQDISQVYAMQYREFDIRPPYLKEYYNSVQSMNVDITDKNVLNTSIADDDTSNDFLIREGCVYYGGVILDYDLSASHETEWEHIDSSELGYRDEINLNGNLIYKDFTQTTDFEQNVKDNDIIRYKSARQWMNIKLSIVQDDEDETVLKTNTQYFDREDFQNNVSKTIQFIFTSNDIDEHKYKRVRYKIEFRPKEWNMTLYTVYSEYFMIPNSTTALSFYYQLEYEGQDSENFWYHKYKITFKYGGSYTKIPHSSYYYYVTNEIDLKKISKWGDLQVGWNHWGQNYGIKISIDFYDSVTSSWSGYKEMKKYYYSTNDNQMHTVTDNDFNDIDPNYDANNGTTTTTKIKITVYIFLHNGNGSEVPNEYQKWTAELYRLHFFYYVVQDNVTEVSYHNISSIMWNNKYLMAYTKLNESYNNYIVCIDNFLDTQHGTRYYLWYLPKCASLIWFGQKLMFIKSDESNAFEVYKFEDNPLTPYRTEELPIYYETSRYNVPYGIFKRFSEVEIVFEPTSGYEQLYRRDLIPDYLKHFFIEVYIDEKYAGTLQAGDSLAYTNYIRFNTVKLFEQDQFESLNIPDIKIHNTSTDTEAVLGYGLSIQFKFYWKPLTAYYNETFKLLNLFKLKAIRIYFETLPHTFYTYLTDLRQGVLSQ